MIYLVKHSTQTLVLVASLLFSLVSFSEETKPQFVKDYESGYGKYFQVRSEASETVNLRSIASDDPNAPIKKDEAMEGFKKYLALQKEKQKRRENFDLDKDGKTDCKRKFFPNSSQIKTEVCDFNHDGVVDLKTKYNKDGLAVLELTNFDKDKFFEKKVSCKTIAPDKEVAKCVTSIRSRSKSHFKIVSSKVSFLASFKKAIENNRTKRETASLTSLRSSNVRFTSKDLPDTSGMLETFQSMIDVKWSNADRNYFLEKYEQRKYLKDNNYKLPVNLNQTKWASYFKDFKPGEDVGYMKYITGLTGFDPKTNPSCLRASEACCQFKVDYKKVNGNLNKDGSYGDSSDYTSCIHYSVGWCSDFGDSVPIGANWCDDSKSKTEGEAKPCFECWGDLGKVNEYTNILNETSAAESGYRPPKGFKYAEFYDVLIHESCEGVIDIDAILESSVNSCTHPDSGSTKVQGNIHKTRIARALLSSNGPKYAKITGNKADSIYSGEKEALDSWGTSKKFLEDQCKRLNACEDFLFEDEVKPKIFCVDDKNDELDYVERTLPNLKQGYLMENNVLYAPPITVFNKSIEGGVSNAIDKGLYIHSLFHILGYTHGVPKYIESKGKYRCGWNAEPDYAFLCDPSICAKVNYNDMLSYTCDMKPDAHIDKETGDLREDYMRKLAHEGYGFSEGDNEFRNPFKLVDDPADCSTAH